MYLRLGEAHTHQTCRSRRRRHDDAWCAEKPV